MNDDDRKFLTEAMGEKWVDPYFEDYTDYGKGRTNLRIIDKNRTFTTWADFGAVWEWAQKQEWWPDLWRSILYSYSAGFNLKGIEWTIDPLRFPQLVVDFLKEAKK